MTKVFNHCETAKLKALFYQSRKTASAQQIKYKSRNFLSLLFPFFSLVLLHLTPMSTNPQNKKPRYHFRDIALQVQNKLYV